MDVKPQTIIDKINSREAIVAVIGLGYVGLPLAVEKASAGFKTMGFDIINDRVKIVNEGRNYIGDIVDSELSELVKRGFLSATTDFSMIKQADFIAICVPTPLDQYQQPDISYVKSATEKVAKYMKEGSMVVLESTTYPGTTEELIKPILEKGSGLKCEEQFYLAYSPERVDPGNRKFKTKNTPKVVGGIGEASTKIAAAMYRSVLDSEVFEVSSPKVAEMEKLLENIYRNINIGLANEMAIICEKMDISVWEVIDAASTKPYGFQAFYPGPGLGGHCIPLDPYYLAWKSREFDYHTQLIETSGIINDRMPYYVIERISKVLNNYKKPLKDSKILVLGVAYKQDISDYRESPALKVIELLEKEQCIVEFYDPHIDKYEYKGNWKKGLEKIDANVLSSFDIAVITTMHTSVDYDLIQQNSKVIFDTKNAMKDIEQRDNIRLL